MGKHVHNIWHCSATPEGVEFDKDDILRWHMGPKPLSEGFKYKGKVYRSRKDIPHEKIGGKFAADITGRGWDRPGYSKLVLLDGTVQTLVRVNENRIIESHEMTWGALGVNSISMHFCYIGGCEKEKRYNKRMGKMWLHAKDTRTKEQLFAMTELTIKQIDKHPDTMWSGHNQHNRKECPSFWVPDFCDTIGLRDKNVYRKKLS